jgi:hypothetical protein
MCEVVIGICSTTSSTHHFLGGQKYKKKMKQYIDSKQLSEAHQIIQKDYVLPSVNK